MILETIQFSPTLKLPSNIDGENYLLPCLIIPFIGFLLSKGKSVRDLVEFICTFFLGSLVGLAVMIGGLVSQKRVLDFFNFTNPIYNPRIVIFLLTAVVINLIFFSIIKKRYQIHNVVRFPCYATTLKLMRVVFQSQM